MEPTQELIDELFWEQIRFARQQTPGERISAGAELFDLACEIARGGIRRQFPNAAPEEVERILRERLALREKLERRE